MRLFGVNFSRRRFLTASAFTAAAATGIPVLQLTKIPAPNLTGVTYERIPLTNVHEYVGIGEAIDRHDTVVDRAKRQRGQHLPSVHLFVNGLRAHAGDVSLPMFELLTSVLLQRGKEFIMVPVQPIPRSSIDSLEAVTRHQKVFLKLNGELVAQTEMWAGYRPDEPVVCYDERCEWCSKLAPTVEDLRRHQSIAHKDIIRDIRNAERVAEIILKRGLLT
jgi:hypothetical protein